MAWTLFASLLNPKLPDLDTNLSTLANLGIVPCSLSGTSTILATPLSPNLPPINSYANTQAFIGRAGNGNTGATTFQYQSLNQLNVYKDTASGPSALVGAEIVQNQMCLFAYDSSLNGGLGGVHLINPIGAGGGGGSVTPPGSIAVTSIGSLGYRSTLKILVASNTTLTITAKTVVVGNATQGTFINIPNLSATLNTASAGAANALDVGTLGSNAWYYVYAIYNPATATAATLLSLNSTTPALPGGYTLYARIGSVRTDGSAHFIPTLQYDNTVSFTGAQFLDIAVADTGGTLTAYSITSVVPPTAGQIGLRLLVPQNVTALVSPVTPTASNQQWLEAETPTGAAACVAGMFIIEDPTNVYYLTTGAGAASARLTCYGWVDNL